MNQSFRKHFITLLLSVCAFSTYAQERFMTISGTVRDKQTKKKLESVNVTVQNTDIGTVTNADGYFSIKVSDAVQAKNLLISYIGYENLLYPIGTSDVENAKFYLTPDSYVLDEITIFGGNARELVDKAVDKIEHNYEAESNMLTGFYREIIQKRRRYVNISEAVVNMYKSPYKDGIRSDRVQIHKGRKLLSQKSSDTIIVKLMGGPTLAVNLDIAKNKNILFAPNELDNYSFTYGMSVTIDNRPHYAIDFKPKMLTEYALFYGTLYIDKGTLAVTRAELNLAKDDLDKATKDILRKKPAGLRFKLNDLSYVVSYRPSGGRNHIYYVRSDIKFRCDWKRRLFHTNYTVSSEMVVTDRQSDNVSNIPSKDSFRQSQSLSDKVSNFYDPDFWGNYNIIEPAESLENAINKLKKQYKSN